MTFIFSELPDASAATKRFELGKHPTRPFKKRPVTTGMRRYENPLAEKGHLSSSGWCAGIFTCGQLRDQWGWA